MHDAVSAERWAQLQLTPGYAKLLSRARGEMQVCARGLRGVLDRIVRQVVCEGGGGARTASVADREIGTMCWLMPIHPRRLCWLLLAASAGRRPSWRRR